MNLSIPKKSRFSVSPSAQATDRSKSSSSSSSSDSSPTTPNKNPPPRLNLANASPFKKIQMLKQQHGRERSNSVNSLKLPSILERRNKDPVLHVDTLDKKGSTLSINSSRSPRNESSDANNSIYGRERTDSGMGSSEKKNSIENSKRRGSLFGFFKKNTEVATPKAKIKEEAQSPFMLLPPAIREQLIKARESVMFDPSQASHRMNTQESGGLMTEVSVIEGPGEINPKLKRCLYVVYFLGIMLSFKNRVKMIQELRAQEVKEDIEIVERKSFFPILPTANFSLAWTVCMMGLILLVSIITPFHVSFIDDENSTFEIIEHIFNILFGIDIIINFLSAYYDTRIGLITSWKRIIINYCSFWFWVDLSSTIPFDLIILEASGDHNSTAYNKLLRLLRFPRLYKLLKILRLFKIAKLLSTNQNASKFMKKINVNWGIITVIKTFVKIFFLNHLVACFWFYIARLNDYSPQTWVYRLQLVDSDPWTQYVTSFYWAFQTLATVGYGDIPPVTDGERVITILWMMVGVGFYALTIEKISTILANLDRRSQILKKKMNAFNQFAIRVNLSNYLRQKVQRYFELNHKENVSCWIDPPNMIEELPSNLRWGLLLFSYHQMIKNIKLLQQDGNFTANIVAHLKMLKLNKNEILYREEENSEEIYFISKGGVKLVTEEGEGIFSFVEGTYFGEIEILEGCKRKYFCQSTQPTLLLVCPKKVFLTNIKKFPEIQTTVEKTYSLRIEKIKSKLHIPNVPDTLPNHETEQAAPKKPKKKLLKANAFFYQVIMKAAEKDRKEKSVIHPTSTTTPNPNPPIPVPSSVNESKLIASGSQSNTHMGIAALFSPKTLPDQLMTADRALQKGNVSFMDAIKNYNKRNNVGTEANETKTDSPQEEHKQGQGEENQQIVDPNPKMSLQLTKVVDSPRTVAMRKLNALAAASLDTEEDESPPEKKALEPIFTFPSFENKGNNTIREEKKEVSESMKSPKIETVKSPHLQSNRDKSIGELNTAKSPNLKPTSQNELSTQRSPQLLATKNPFLAAFKAIQKAPSTLPAGNTTTLTTEPNISPGRADNKPPESPELKLKSPTLANKPLKIKMNDIVKSGKIIKEAENKDPKDPPNKEGELNESPSKKKFVPPLNLNKLNTPVANAVKSEALNLAELAKKDPKKFLKTFKGSNEDKNLITSLLESFNKITKVREECEKKLRDIEIQKMGFAEQFSAIGDKQIDIQEKVEQLLEKYL